MAQLHYYYMVDKIQLFEKSNEILKKKMLLELYWAIFYQITILLLVNFHAKT